MRNWPQRCGTAFVSYSTDVSVLEAAGAWPLPVAIAGGWRGDHHASTARLPARRHRLADAATHVASASCGLIAAI